MCTALIDKGAVPKENVTLFAASKDTSMCTLAGMKQTFLEQASQVGEKGIFIFHFSGHGIKVANEWGLAPADYDYTTATYLTGSVLNHWLLESKCKARRVLFALDCCYAGGLAEELTSGDIELRPGLYVLSACTAFETSLVVGPLGHSIFAYFLAYALRVSPFPPGKLPMAQVFKECGTLCTALSSLLISYKSTLGLKFGTMQPELRHTVDLHSSVRSWVEESLKLTPGSLHPAEACHREKYDFVMKYCKNLPDLHQHQLSELCLKWLEYIADTNSPTSPLAELARRNLLNNEVLCAAVCSIMWSVASIQMEEDHSNVNTSETFLLGFLHTAAAIECFGGSELTLQHLKQSWQFYQAVLASNKVDDHNLQQLYGDINRDLKALRETETGNVSVSVSASLPQHLQVRTCMHITQSVECVLQLHGVEMRLGMVFYHIAMSVFSFDQALQINADGVELEVRSTY